MSLDEAHPQRHQQGRGVFEQQPDADREAADRHEVERRDEEEAGYPVDDQQRQLATGDLEPGGPRERGEQEQSHGRAGRAKGGELGCVDAGAEGELGDGAVDGEERAAADHHEDAEAGTGLGDHLARVAGQERWPRHPLRRRRAVLVGGLTFATAASTISG